MSMTAVLVTAAVLEAVSQIRQGVSQARAAKFNANVSEILAKQRERQNAITQYRLERQKRAMLGRQRALYAKAGVDLQGSPLEVLADTEAQYELDKQIANYNATVDATRYRYNALYQREVAKDYLTSGWLRAGGTLLTAYVGMKGIAKAKPTYGSYKYWHKQGLAYRAPRGFEQGFATRMGLG